MDMIDIFQECFMINGHDDLWPIWLNDNDDFYDHNNKWRYIYRNVSSACHS